LTFSLKPKPNRIRIRRPGRAAPRASSSEPRVHISRTGHFTRNLRFAPRHRPRPRLLLFLLVAAALVIPLWLPAGKRTFRRALQRLGLLHDPPRQTAPAAPVETRP
jgi:hypothetical protein